MIILASASPRRRELLAHVCEFEVRATDCDESCDIASTEEFVRELSRRKALACRADEGDIVIGADTVVAIDGTVLGKPRSEQDAYAMLSRLSGRHHTVYTGVTVSRGGKVLTAHEATRVHFRPLTSAEIEAYIATGEPMDKAGSYGIQGYGAMLVEGISGDYFNVVGLPLCRLYLMLKELETEM